MATMSRRSWLRGMVGLGVTVTSIPMVASVGEAASGAPIEWLRRELNGKVRVSVSQSAIKQWNLAAESGRSALAGTVAVLANGRQVASRPLAFRLPYGPYGMLATSGFTTAFSFPVAVPFGARLEVWAKVTGTVATHPVSGQSGKYMQLDGFNRFSTWVRDMEVGTIEVRL